MKYSNKMYSHFKNDLADIIIDFLKPVQSKYYKLIEDKEYINKILKEGSERAQNIAYKTLDKVYRKIGLIKKIRD